jgi:hypothetical protein
MMVRSSKQTHNPVTAALFNMHPPGFQIEARHADNQAWTDYRFTRLSDGVWCQELLEDTIAYSARSPHAVAAMILKVALAKFDKDGYD